MSEENELEKSEDISSKATQDVDLDAKSDEIASDEVKDATDNLEYADNLMPMVPAMNTKRRVYNAAKVEPPKPVDLNKTTILVSALIALATVAIVLFAVSWVYSIDLADVEAKSKEYEKKLDKEFANANDGYNRVKDAANRALDSKTYDEADTVAALLRIQNYLDENDIKKWFNPYSGEYLKKWQERQSEIEEWEAALRANMIADIDSSITALGVDASALQAAQSYIDAEDKKTVAYEPIDIETAQSNLEKAYALAERVSEDESYFNLYSENDYVTIVERIKNVVTQNETTFRAAMISQLYAESADMAQKEYDSKVEELTKQLKEQATNEAKQESNKTITEKDSKIATLEKQLEEANNTINSLRKQLESKQQ